MEVKAVETPGLIMILVGCGDGGGVGEQIIGRDDIWVGMEHVVGFGDDFAKRQNGRGGPNTRVKGNGDWCGCNQTGDIVMVARLLRCDGGKCWCKDGQGEPIQQSGKNGGSDRGK